MSETDKAKAALLELLGSRPIAYYVAFAEISGGVTSGVLLSQLFYWHGKGSDPAGWIYKTQADWTQETGLTRWEQETARRRLRERGIIEEKRAGVPARLHFRLDVDQAIDLLAQSSMWKSHNLECGKATIKDEGNPQTRVRESDELLHRLPESTAESEAESTAAAAGSQVLCSIHHVPMQARSKDGETWYSHRLPDGSWCKGAPGDGKPKTEPITATCPGCYLVGYADRLCSECGLCPDCCTCEEA
jgi:hypothetical protein